MLDLADPQNPFRDWSWVYIPSCSGDVHTGDARVRYGSVVVEQRGWQNAHAALERAFASSTRRGARRRLQRGSVGSAWHAEEVIRAWPDARVAQLGDSLAFLFHRGVRLGEWGANKHFPSFFQVGDRRWTMEEFESRLAGAYPDVTFARFNRASDDVQQAFYEAVGGNPADFPPAAACGRGPAEAAAELPLLPRVRGRPLRPAEPGVLEPARRRRVAPRLGRRPRRGQGRRLSDLRVGFRRGDEGSRQVS